MILGWSLLAVAFLLAGCSAAPHERPFKVPHTRPFTLPADEVPVPIGRGPGFRLAAISPAVRRRARVAGLTCTRSHRNGYGAHLELFAQRLVLLVPAGIGIAPPQRASGAYVLGGACTYPVKTFEPTGVIVVDRGQVRTLRALFAVWGQPVSSDRLAGFRGPVEAFVDGRRWRGPPGEIPLRRHAEIVLELGGHVPPHPAYRFAPGL